jgi:hypothetical protein
MLGTPTESDVAREMLPPYTLRSIDAAGQEALSPRSNTQIGLALASRYSEEEIASRIARLPLHRREQCLKLVEKAEIDANLAGDDPSQCNIC